MAAKFQVYGFGRKNRKGKAATACENPVFLPKLWPGRGDYAYNRGSIF
jgi:hypothetical protein